MTPEALIRIERLNYWIGAALIGLSLAVGTRGWFLGMSCGVVISALNFSIVRRLVAQILWGPVENRRRVAALFVPKMAVLMLAVSAIVYFLPISPIAFAIGFSVFLASIAIESVRFVTQTPVSGPGDGSNEEEVGSQRHE